jgi:hypothetical protein
VLPAGHLSADALSAPALPDDSRGVLRVSAVHQLARAAGPAAAFLHRARLLSDEQETQARGQDQPGLRLCLPSGRQERGARGPLPDRADRQLVDRGLQAGRATQPDGDGVVHLRVEGC